HPRGLRLHDRTAGRALLPRRAADDHRRGDQRDPAPGDRPRPPGALSPLRLTGRRVLVVGAGTRPSPEPDAPMGNGRAISVLAGREGATVACADVDKDAADETARLV